MTADAAAVVDRYLAVVADLDGDPHELTALLDPAFRVVEHPNAVAPTGRMRDRAAAIAAAVHARRLLSSTRFDVREHIVAGERVVTRVGWTGVLAVDAGAWPAGTEMRAECCMVFTVRDGRIVWQDTYDCYEPVEIAVAAVA